MPMRSQPRNVTEGAMTYVFPDVDANDGFVG